MKTTFLNFYKHIQQPQWKQLNDSLKTLTSELVFWLSGLRLHGDSISQSLNQILIRGRVVQGASASLLALVKSTVANKRLFVGLVLMGIVAPLSGCIYMLFDQTVKIEDWYYLNNFYLFLVLGPFIKDVVICIGVYHAFPNKSKRALLLAVPMGFSIAKIIWLYTINSHDEFYSIPPGHIVFVGILVSVVILMSIEWFAWRWAHRTRAFDSRLDGLDNIVDEDSISDSQFRSMFRQVYRDKKEFPKQY